MAPPPKVAAAPKQSLVKESSMNSTTAVAMTDDHQPEQPRSHPSPGDLKKDFDVALLDRGTPSDIPQTIEEAEPMQESSSHNCSPTMLKPSDLNNEPDRTMEPLVEPAPTSKAGGAIAMEDTSSSTAATEDIVANMPRSVSFGTLHVREFPVALGDNPSVQFGGPPIRLEYQRQQEEYIVPLHEYETQRQQRRKSAELRVPATLRRDWVGHDADVEREIAQHQRQRSHSIAMHEWDDWNYTLERVVRGVSKRFGRRKQQDEDCPADQWYRQYKRERKPPT